MDMPVFSNLSGRHIARGRLLGGYLRVIGVVAVRILLVSGDNPTG